MYHKLSELRLLTWRSWQVTPAHERMHLQFNRTRRPRFLFTCLRPALSRLPPMTARMRVITHSAAASCICSSDNTNCHRVVVFSLMNVSVLWCIGKQLGPRAHSCTHNASPWATHGDILATPYITWTTRLESLQAICLTRLRSQASAAPARFRHLPSTASHVLQEVPRFGLPRGHLRVRRVRCSLGAREQARYAYAYGLASF